MDMLRAAWDRFTYLLRYDLEFSWFVLILFFLVLPLYSYYVSFSCEGYEYVETHCVFGNCSEVSGSLCDMVDRARAEKKELDLWLNTSEGIMFYRPAANTS